MNINSDEEMRVQVLATIQSLPTVKPGDCEVYVNAGVVTLCGRVDTYQALSDIEHQVSRIAGIHGIQTYIQTDVGNDQEQRSARTDRRCTVRDRRMGRPG
jgi:osmotically-inducible protein OsmY